MDKELKDEIERLVLQGAVDEAMEKLSQFSGANEVSPDILTLIVRYKKLEKDYGFGYITPESYHAEYIKITKATISAVAALNADDTEGEGIFPMDSKTDEKAKSDHPFRPNVSAWWKYVVAAGVVIGLIAGTIGIVDAIRPTPPLENVVTILVHSTEGRDKCILPGRGVVRLVYGNAVPPVTIDANCEANFKQVPSRFFDEDVGVEIWFEDPSGENYRAVHHDSIYQLERGKYIPLEVKLYGMDSLHGIVREHSTGIPLDSVLVIVNRTRAWSNEYGEFEVVIPARDQQSIQAVKAFHSDYQPFYQETVAVSSEIEIPITMRPN